MNTLLKKSTGLTGLAVSTSPHYTLTALYGKIMRAVAKMPENAAYRKYTEKIITERAKLVACTPNVLQLEQKIGCGQVEELIVQAENELLLARKMLGWKPWDPLQKAEPAQQWDWPPAQIKSLQH